MILNKVFIKIDYLMIKIRTLYFKFINGKKLLLGENVHFRKGCNVLIEKNGKVIIGKNVAFNYYSSINCLGRIKIGDYCLFGENVRMYDHNHVFRDLNKNIRDQGMKIGSIEVGNNCWIGSNVTILNNVQIGDNVVIGANCLIYQSIPSNTIVKNNGSLIIENRRS